MAYDRDSFLAGLAVGRTLWRPHRDVPGASVVAYPCFLMGALVPVEFTRYEVDYTDILFVNLSTDIWPQPVYWMLWGDGQNKTILFFSAGGSLSRVTWSAQGVRGDGTISPFSTTLGYLNHYPESELGGYRTWIGYDNEPFTPALFANYAYFDGPENDINAFFETARLIQVEDQLYVAGEA